MDLKQLFHHPEDLDDSELAVLRDKIRFQQSLPYWSALFMGLSMRIVSPSCQPARIGVAAAFGFWVGASSASTVTSNLWRRFDKDITRAFDERYMTRTLNLAGLGSNYTSEKDNEDYSDFSKPY